MACYGTFSIFPEPVCGHEDPKRPGVRCTRTAHPKWEVHVCAGGGGHWPGEGEAPPLCPKIGSREGTEKAFAQEWAKEERERYGSNDVLWGRR
jgi:hypothetical protein